MKEFEIDYLDGAMIYTSRRYAASMVEAIEVELSKGRNVVSVKEILRDIYFKAFS